MRALPRAAHFIGARVPVVRTTGQSRQSINGEAVEIHEPRTASDIGAVRNVHGAPASHLKHRAVWLSYQSAFAWHTLSRDQAIDSLTIEAHEPGAARAAAPGAVSERARRQRHGGAA